jgi:dolichol-phosphate hexosyltransferase
VHVSATPIAESPRHTVASPATVTVVIPTKNEEGCVGRIIEGVRPYADELLVVDGHSTDATRRVCESLGARVILDRGRGKGDAIRLALTAATGEIVVFIDADGSHDPDDIPRLVAPIQAGMADLVIGSRGKGGSDELHGTFEQLLRYLGSQIIMLAINYRWGVRLTDSQNGFRAIRRRAGCTLGLRANLTTIEQEMLMKALKHRLAVAEVPTHEHERVWGRSKVSVWKLWWAYVWSLLINLL